MTIMRVHKTGDFAIIANAPLNDQQLSWAARGLMAYLLSKPNDWTVQVQDIIRRGTMGRDGVYAMLRELGEHGYIEKVQDRREDGTLGPVSYIVHEIPVAVIAEHYADSVANKERAVVPDEPASLSVEAPVGMGLFVSAYPAHRRRQSEEAIRTAWAKATERTDVGTIMLGLAAHKASWKWKNEPEYIPGIVRFLDERRWEDPVAAPPRQRPEDVNAGGRGELVI